MTALRFTLTTQARPMVRRSNDAITTVDELRIAVRNAETDIRAVAIQSLPTNAEN